MKSFISLFFSILFITQLAAQHKANAYLGVRAKQVKPEKSEILGFDRTYGEYISAVIPNTAASKNELKVFDYIYKLGDFDLKEDRSLRSALRQYDAGDEVDVFFYRDGQKKVKTIQLGSSWDNEEYHRPAEEDPFLGVHEAHWDNPEKLKGVKVNVSNNTTAMEIGMKDGDIIIAIDKNQMLDWHDVVAAIDNRKVAENINVNVFRNGQVIALSGPIRPKSASHKKDWNWDWDWQWDSKWNKDQQRVDIQNMEAEVAEIGPEELEQAIEDTGIDMPKENNLTINDLTVFPNPNLGMFNLDFSLPNQGDALIRVFSATGQMVFSRNINNFQGDFSENLDIMAAGPGIYFLMVRQRNYSVTRKIIISRN